MVESAPTLANALFDATAHTLTNVNEAVPPLGNTVLLGENLYMIFRAGTNCYLSYNPISKLLFASGCVCGVIGATSSGIALATSCMGLPTEALAATFSGRAFNRAGKYVISAAKFTNGSIVESLPVVDLVK